MHFYGLPSCSNAPLRRTSSPRCTYKLGFGFSFPIILTIIHWTNNDPNKLMKGFLQVYKLYEKCSVRFASAIRSLGKHCFLPSSINRMIRMSKDEEIGKNERNNIPEGSRVKVNLNKTPRIPD